MSDLVSGPTRGSTGSVGAQDDEQRGIDRRTLIKRAAASGAVAWTAPAILESLTSPASALTCGGCFRFQIAAQSFCDQVTQTEGVSTISPCGTLSAAGCTSPTDVAAGVPANDFPGGIEGGVCTDIPGTVNECDFGNVIFDLGPISCTWGGGGTCNAPRRFLAAQANTRTACVAGSINATGSSVTFIFPGGTWQHFQFIVGCSCA